MKIDHPTADFVDWFRQSSPYIRAFRGRTFVVNIAGECLRHPRFYELIHDVVLLHSLGIRVVLVYGLRPQIDQCMQDRGLESHYAEDMRITDDAALNCVKACIGQVSTEIEALISMGLSHNPIDRTSATTISGNFVIAQPAGVRNGIDFLHTGKVRNINAKAIHKQLEDGHIVLLSPVGYSPTSEVFNLHAETVATQTAIALNADKLIFINHDEVVTDADNNVLRELTQNEARELISKNTKLDKSTRAYLEHASIACAAGVPRVHILDQNIDGALLLEFFTRDGVGTLISAENFEDVRQANIDDVSGILDLITPLENEGALVRRSRERLEMEIEHFTVIERDGSIVACAAVYDYEKDHASELACLAVHPDYQKQGRGDQLFNYILRECKKAAITQLFVLTTQTTHWFKERGFKEAEIEQLPVSKQEFYNFQRKSKVYIKTLNN